MCCHVGINAAGKVTHDWMSESRHFSRIMKSAMYSMSEKGIQTGSICCRFFCIGLVFLLRCHGSARIIKPVSVFSYRLPPLLHNKTWFVCKLQEQRGSFLLPLRIHPSVTLNSRCTLHFLALCRCLRMSVGAVWLPRRITSFGRKHISKAQCVRCLIAESHTLQPDDKAQTKHLSKMHKEDKNAHFCRLANRYLHRLHVSCCRWVQS